MPKSSIPVDELIQQLHGSDWTSRCDAARLLGQSRDPRAVDALLPDLKDPDWRVRRNAAQALGALRDKRATQPLMDLLNDRTMTVRQRAVVALGRIKDTEALPALLNVFLQGRHESYEASKAIRKFGKKALPEIVQAFEKSNNSGLLLMLVEMKYEGAFEVLLKSLESDDRDSRLLAIRQMGLLGDKRAVSHLIAQLDDNDLALQSELVEALGKLEATEAAPALLRLLVDDELYGPRSSVYHAVTKAIQSFGGIADEIEKAFPGSYPAMFNMGGAQMSLPETMGLMGSQSGMLDDIVSRLQTGVSKLENIPGPVGDAMKKSMEEMAWKFGVMFADARDAKQERVRRLIELLDSDLPLPRAGAALSLPWYGEERSLEHLKRLLHDPDEMVRVCAGWASSALQKVISYRNQFGM